MGGSEELAFKLFIKKMKKRLEEKSADGYYGFETLTPVELEWKFQEALTKGNVVDIANYLMMLSYIGVDKLGKAAETDFVKAPETSPTFQVVGDSIHASSHFFSSGTFTPIPNVVFLDIERDDNVL